MARAVVNSVLWFISMATYSPGEPDTASPFDTLRTGPSRRPCRPPQGERDLAREGPRQDERIREHIYGMLHLAV
jgi:hypothetical protein